MIDLLTNTLAFVFALGVIIFVHELGHLLVAKLFDVRVETFSLGFGPRLGGFRRGETDYRISAVPLGGYVKLGGELPDEVEGDPREFLSKPRWQRVLVYLAGPAMNVVLAVALIAGVFMVGTEVSDLPDVPPVIGEVAAGSSGEAAGLRPGDRVLAVGGEEVGSWPDVSFALLTSPGRPLRLTVARGEESFEAVVTPGVHPKYQLGDFAGLYPETLPSVLRFDEPSPALDAGLRVNDQLRSVDGRPVTGTREFIEYIQGRAGREVVLGVKRGGQRLEIAVVPAAVDGKGRLGIFLGFYQRYGPLEAVVQSVRYNVQIVEQTFMVLGKLLTGELSPKGALAGPIEIAAQSGAAARTGFKYLIHLMGFISISIAIVNLLPIPVLDGGQILILAIEGVMRRDLSFRIKELISQFGFVVIILLMLVVIYFDLSKNWPPAFLRDS
jgi:regulator of sigma E protease